MELEQKKQAEPRLGSSIVGVALGEWSKEDAWSLSSRCNAMKHDNPRNDTMGSIPKDDKSGSLEQAQRNTIIVC